MLKLGGRTFDATSRLIMGIVNATPDSFYDAGRAYELGPALEIVDQWLAEGADIIDIGGVRAGMGEEVTAAQEIKRVEPLIAGVRERYPSALISIDTWRAEVARVAIEAGADLVNDAWGGFDHGLADVVAEYGAALVRTHTAGLTPRTYAHRVRYDHLLPDVIGYLTRLAREAEAAGVRRDGIIIDPGHDFAKNTWHSLELTRRLDEIVGLGWPVLVAPSNKDFIGESLGLPKYERIEGTLATVALCAWHGAMIFRVHNVRQSRRAVDMISSIAGIRPPSGVVRTLS